MRKRRRKQRLEQGVYTHPAQVPGTIFRSRGLINIGKSPKLIKGLKKGAMTNQAIKLGYIDEGQTISDIPKGKMDDFARDLVESVGAGRAMKMVNVQINLRANQRNEFKDKMLIAKNVISRKSRVLKVHIKNPS